jgi:glucoamylase
VTAQERWEENSGYSPSTLATVIAGLVCAAEFSRERGEADLSAFVLAYADWLVAHLEDWTVTTEGELVEGYRRHYIRINPTDPEEPDPHADPNTTMLAVANGGGLHPARNIVGGDFLHLVRLGIRSADDRLVRDSIEVLDSQLRVELPQGPGWRRYNHDGYGQKEDGSAFDGAGVGHCWPILTGERGHYELAAGHDPMPFLTAMEGFANDGGMISEQLWDAEDLPGRRLRRGQPTGAAMPLCWSHAEYVSLVRSLRDGVCFDRVEPAYQRYVLQPVVSQYEIWSPRHPLRRMARGKILRIVTGAAAEIRWSLQPGSELQAVNTRRVGAMEVWSVDLPTQDLAMDSCIEFTLRWHESPSREAGPYALVVIAPAQR